MAHSNASDLEVQSSLRDFILTSHLLPSDESLGNLHSPLTGLSLGGRF